MTYVHRCQRPASHSEQPEVGLARAWNRGAAPFCITLALLSGCRATNPEQQHVAHASDASISTLQSLAERIAVSEAILSEKEALAREAESEARFSECRAQVAEVNAGVALSRAQCLEQLASEAQCKAEGAREKGDRNARWLSGLAFWSPSLLKVLRPREHSAAASQAECSLMLRGTNAEPRIALSASRSSNGPS